MDVKLTNKHRLLITVAVCVAIGVAGVKLYRQATPLDRRLVSTDNSIRNSALSTLENLPSDEKDRLVPFLAAHAKNSTKARERQFALYALRKSGQSTNPDVHAAMIGGLADKDDKVVEEATVGLREAGDSAIPQLVRALTDKRARTPAIRILSNEGPKVVPELAGALSSPDYLSQRGAAAIAMALTVPETVDAARSLQPRLAELLVSTDPIVSVNAAMAMHRIAPADTRPVSVFLRQMSSTDEWGKWEVRGWQSLENLLDTPGAKAYAPKLAAMIPNAPDNFTRKRSKRFALAMAVEQLAPRSHVTSERVADLKSPDRVIRYRAVCVIGSTLPVSQAAAAPLIGALDDPDAGVAARAMWALTRLGLDNTERWAQTAYPKYLALLNRVDEDEIPGFHEMAGTAISRIGKPILPPLIEMIAANKLRLGPSLRIFFRLDQDCVPFLQGCLSNKNANVRLGAALALARLAPKTPGLVEHLEAGRNQPDAIRKSVEDAIEFIKTGKEPVKQNGKGGGKRGRKGRQGKNRKRQAQQDDSADDNDSTEEPADSAN